MKNSTEQNRCPDPPRPKSPEIKPIPEKLGRALIEAGYEDVGIITIAEIGQRPKTFFVPGKAEVVDERLELDPENIRIPEENVAESRYFSYILQGSTTQTVCQWESVDGVPVYVCTKVRTR